MEGKGEGTGGIGREGKDIDVETSSARRATFIGAYQKSKQINGFLHVVACETTICEGEKPTPSASPPQTTTKRATYPPFFASPDAASCWVVFSR